jgi:hypothetical protein
MLNFTHCVGNNSRSYITRAHVAPGLRADNNNSLLAAVVQLCAPLVKFDWQVM